jgi:hypothetical protein
MAYLIPMVRNAMLSTAVITFIPGILYIASIHVKEWGRQGLIWPAIFLDIFGPAMLVAIERGPKWLGPKLSTWARKTYDFIPGANIEHKIERTNAFVALVFGYSVIALLYQSAVEFPLNTFFGKAALFLIIAFVYNWIYFEIDTFNMHTHAIRRHFWSCKLSATSRSCANFLKHYCGYQHICLSSWLTYWPLLHYRKLFSRMTCLMPKLSGSQSHITCDPRSTSNKVYDGSSVVASGCP